MVKNATDAPIWPDLPTDLPPSLEETTAHNLAVIAAELGRLATTMERVSENLRAIRGAL